ncbi:purine permease 3-like isoform X1 [Hibiscus syriacus]|uniref:purine permease 3-like isoform X1 n=2 Tax=Hibiscus syriacus TaxID=106335 RepID=UPI0019213149|nr:purine permease 3-like isoform X1 [Hibiscus syriacus]
MSPSFERIISLETRLMMEEKMSKGLKRMLLVLNCTMLGLGNVGGPLISRLYFLKGGKGVWISSCLETAGWPFMTLPLTISYLYRRRKDGPGTKVVFMKPPLFVASVVLGLLTGIDDFLYAYGVARLPISTSALIISTQLAFTAAFAFLLVKPKFTPFTINSIFLLTLGAVVLALHTSSDRPANESKLRYFMGFFMTLGASALYGFVLPAIELTYKKANQTVTYSLVMEMQMVMSFSATVFCCIGMIFHGDFKAIPREASEYELGQATYYVVLVLNAMLWQMFFMGAVGVIFSASSLLSGVIIAALLPVTESLAVLFYHEKFQVEKGVALVLSLWGSLNYLYGEFEENKKMEKQNQDLETEIN